MTTDKITNAATESYQNGAVQKIRKEKWAYDRAFEHGAVDRYQDGLNRMAHIRESRVVVIPGKVSVIPSTTVQGGTGVVMVNRMVGPVLDTQDEVVYHLHPEASIGVKSVGTPYRAIRAAIEDSPTDIKPHGEGWARSQERARNGVAKMDGLADALTQLDRALLDYARMAKKGNAKSRATFRALCYRLQHFDCPRAALQEINLGERDAKPLPKGAVQCKTFVKDHTYYLERVR